MNERGAPHTEPREKERSLSFKRDRSSLQSTVVEGDAWNNSALKISVIKDLLLSITADPPPPTSSRNEYPRWSVRWDQGIIRQCKVLIIRSRILQLVIYFLTHWCFNPIFVSYRCQKECNLFHPPFIHSKPLLRRIKKLLPSLFPFFSKFVWTKISVVRLLTDFYLVQNNCLWARSTVV